MSDIKINGVSILGGMKPEAKDKLSGKNAHAENNGSIAGSDHTILEASSIEMSARAQQLKQQIEQNEYKVDVNKLTDKLINQIILNL